MDKKKIFLFFVILIFIPFILDLILRFIWWLPITIPAIAEQKDWLGFLGGYLGIIVSILIVLWQQKAEKEQEVKGLLFYIKDILEYNCENYTKEYIEKLNNQAISLIWCPNLYQEEIKLKNFELTREDILLLYKNNHKNIIKLNEKIKEISNEYSLTLEEENNFKEAESLLKYYIREGKLPEESIILLDILIIASKYIYLGMKKRKIPDINILNKKLQNLNKKVLEKENFNLNSSNKEDILNEFLEFCKPLKDDYDSLKEKYFSGLYLLYKIVASDDIKIGIVLNEAICKKIKLSDFNKYFNLSDEMRIIIKEIETEI